MKSLPGCSIQDPKKKNTDKPTIIFEGRSTWLPPKQHLTFENVTRLDQFVSHPDYNSSDEEHSDGEDERRNRAGSPPDDELNFLTPLKSAKLTHLFTRLPTTHAKLRNGDVARVTAFAMDHAAVAAHEVVDMAIRNVFRPLAYTGANPNRKPETEDVLDMSAAKLVGLYIISDILWSSANGGMRHAWRYRQLFETALRSHKVFEHLGRLDKDLKWGRLKAEKWKRSVGALLHQWEGWCCFTQSNQEHFNQVFEKPPLTETELQTQKGTEKTHAEQAAVAFAKSKSRWKTIDDERGNHDPTHLTNENELSTSAHAVGESIYENDGIVMDTGDLEDIDGIAMDISDLKNIDGEFTLEELSLGDEDTQTETPEQPPQHPTESDKSEQPAGQQEPETRRRKPRPKAEDMFASDSE
jgi:U2-associated protein SR140